MKKLLGLCILGMALPTFGQVVMSSNWSGVTKYSLFEEDYEDEDYEDEEDWEQEDEGCKVGNSCGYTTGLGTAAAPWEISDYSDIKRIETINTNHEEPEDRDAARGHFKLVSDIVIEEEHIGLIGFLQSNSVYNIELSGLKGNNEAYVIEFKNGIKAHKAEGMLNSVEFGLFSGLADSKITDIVINANFQKTVQLPYVESHQGQPVFYNVGILTGSAYNTVIDKIAISTFGFKVTKNELRDDFSNANIKMGGVIGSIYDTSTIEYKDIKFAGDVSYESTNTEEDAAHQDISLGGIFGSIGTYGNFAQSINKATYNGKINLLYKTKSNLRGGDVNVAVGGIVGRSENGTTSTNTHLLKNTQSFGEINVQVKSMNIIAGIAGILGVYKPIIWNEPAGKANVSNSISSMKLIVNVETIDDIYNNYRIVHVAGIASQVKESAVNKSFFLGEITTSVISNEYELVKSSILTWSDDQNPGPNNSSENFTLNRYAEKIVVSPIDTYLRLYSIDPIDVVAGTEKTISELNADNGKLWTDNGFNIADGSTDWFYSETVSGLFIPNLIHTHSSEYKPSPTPGPTPNPVDPNSWGFNKFWVIPGILALMAAGVFIYMKKGNKKKVN